MRLIALVTNLSFFGRLSIAPASPADKHLGGWVVLVPVAGALIVGLMARYGSAAIRGHGIPEAMEQVLLNKSRIPARITLLKPISAAISIGTGGPFGAEGRSSPPAAPWARSSASSSTPPRPSARRCSPPAPRRG
jgi:H+/Cl- antiporter ClcA